jgi:hypothetical protein
VAPPGRASGRTKSERPAASLYVCCAAGNMLAPALSSIQVKSGAEAGLSVYGVAYDLANLDVR